MTDIYTYIKPTEEELAIAKRFLDFAYDRQTKLIEMNQTLSEEGIPKDVKDFKDQFIGVLMYQRDKMVELFEDYKTGRVPVPSAFAIKENK